MYDLINIFDTFLPQLLLYPNPTDPLNNEAASLQLKSEDQYNEKIKEYVVLHASAHKPSKPKHIDEESKQEDKPPDSQNNSQARTDDIEAGCDDSGDEIKPHDSELSETSDIEMLDIDDEDERDNQVACVDGGSQ